MTAHVVQLVAVCHRWRSLSLKFRIFRGSVLPSACDECLYTVVCVGFGLVVSSLFGELVMACVRSVLGERFACDSVGFV